LRQNTTSSDEKMMTSPKDCAMCKFILTNKKFFEFYMTSLFPNPVKCEGCGVNWNSGTICEKSNVKNNYFGVQE